VSCRETLNLTGFDFVDVTPDPALSRLNGSYQGMFAAVKMLGGMFILRRVTATNLPAAQAQPQMDPGVAHLHTFLADPDTGGCEFYLVQMSAFARHCYLQ
jgi:hypothetical protein